MAQQHHLYRVPSKPGYLGGYNWRATLLGLLSLAIVSSIATQFIARRFDYQPGLGKPIAQLGHVYIYQPFAWMLWGWRNSTSRDQQVRRPLFEGEMIVFAGSFLSIALFYVVTNRRSRKLSANAEDLHGSARWQTEEDVKNTGLLESTQGVYIGGWSGDGSHIRYLRHNGPEHVLAFAPTRSGKGVGLVIPTLLAWSESAIIYDIKGENWARTAGFRHKAGHLCFKFSPVEQNASSRFNPLAEIRLFTPRDVSDAQNIANMIVRTGEDSPQERYWQDAASSITTGMILHVCYEAALQGRIACPADLAHTFTIPGQSFRETLAEILNFEHDPDLSHNWHMPHGERTATHPVVREKAQEMLDKEDKDFGGVLSTAKTALTLYSDPLVAQNTSASDFAIDDLVNHDRPVSLYLVVPPSDKIRLRPLIRLMFTMVVNRLTERMVFEGAEQKKNRHRLLLLIDEFPSLNRMEVFADALSYMAGYGLKAYLITQDIRQIVDAYGNNESIVSNCHVRIAFAPNQYETAELLSKMTGITTVPKASYSFSGSRFSPVMQHVNASVDHIERPLMTPDEVSRLSPARKEGQGLAERIVAPGQMLIFVSGHFPILGTQMLYFLDPVLSARAELPPPKDFYQIDGGAVIPQKPITKTRNRISKPEPASTEAVELSEYEKGFVEELQLEMFGD
ncbi:MAG TPA: type IV secretory system conjugative DNA transfer family protein [Bryobacteraceae bacterium]|jgi:type IV secretion system protein VirD4|nr:type IV secretory system conjugative DNA transfer family protein [Bryobacteraceae bacterium]